MLRVVSFSFFAGMFSAFNPCGVAVLPAYAAIIASDSSKQEAIRSVGALGVVRTWAVVRAAAGMSLGATVALSGAGAAIALVAAVSQWLVPGIGLLIGLLFVGLGAGSLFGVVQIPALGSLDFSNSTRTTNAPMLLGVTYALASLGCTLPVFMSVVAFSAAGRGFFAGILLYLAYATGLGIILGALVGAAAFGRHYVLAKIRPMRRLVHPIGSLGLVIAGMYLLYRQALLLFV